MATHDQHIDEGLPAHLDWLTFAGLADVRGGMVRRMFDAAVLAVANDLASAPDITTARTITITIKAKPTGMDDRGELAGVSAGLNIKTTTPAREANLALEVRERLDAQGRPRSRGLCHNPDNATNPAQRSLFRQLADEAAAEDAANE